MPVDGEVVGGLVVMTYPAGIVIFGKIFSTPQAKDVSALGQDRFEQYLQANWALKG